MPILSSLSLPVTNPSTGEVTQVTFNLSGGSTLVVPVDPATEPSADGSVWITTT